MEEAEQPFDKLSFHHSADFDSLFAAIGSISTLLSFCFLVLIHDKGHVVAEIDIINVLAGGKGKEEILLLERVSFKRSREKVDLGLGFESLSKQALSQLAPVLNDHSGVEFIHEGLSALDFLVFLKDAYTICR